MLNITASGNFTDRLKRAQIARQSVNRKRANRSPAMPDSNLPAQALHFLHRIWSIAMPRAPKDLADQVAARRRRTRADCNTSHLIDRKAALPNPFVEVGEQGQPRNRKVSGTTKPTRRKRWLKKAVGCWWFDNIVRERATFSLLRGDRALAWQCGDHYITFVAPRLRAPKNSPMEMAARRATVEW